MRQRLIPSVFFLVMLSAQAFATPATPATPDISAEFVSTTCTNPCKTPQIRDWFFWRGQNRVEIRDASGALGELWTRDSKGRLSYIYLEPANKRGIEYNPTDLKIIGQQRNWDRLASLVSPQYLEKLKPVGKTEVLGYQATIYEGKIKDSKTAVTWIPALALAARIAQTDADQTTISELKNIHIKNAPLSATSEAELATYQLVDFADVGDNETSPGMMWLKHATNAPGHEFHEH